MSGAYNKTMSAEYGSGSLLAAVAGIDRALEQRVSEQLRDGRLSVVTDAGSGVWAKLTGIRGGSAQPALEV